MPEMEVQGRRVAWREAGMDRDGVPVILAHCSLAHSGLWKPIIAALGESRPVIALDMPAHGRSDPPPEGASLQIFATQVIETLVETRFRAPAHFVGLSLGGAALSRLAARRPELARSLTVIEPVLFHLLYAPGEEPPAPETMQPDTDLGEALREFMSVWGTPGGYEALGEEGRAYALGVFPYLRADSAWVSGRPPGQIELSDLARLPMPAMLVAGGESPPSAHQVLDAIQGALPQARRRTIAGAGHLSPVTHADSVLAELEDFFASAEAARAPAD